MHDTIIANASSRAERCDWRQEGTRLIVQDDGAGGSLPVAGISGSVTWRAARVGMDAEIVVDNIRTLRTEREALLGLVEELMPTASRLGCEE